MAKKIVQVKKEDFSDEELKIICKNSVIAEAVMDSLVKKVRDNTNRLSKEVDEELGDYEYDIEFAEFYNKKIDNIEVHLGVIKRDMSAIDRLEKLISKGKRR